jgi:hypothetical protein
MRTFSASIWVVGLSVAALGLATWGLVALFSPVRSQAVAGSPTTVVAPSAPVLVPEIVQDRPAVSRAAASGQPLATALLTAVHAAAHPASPTAAAPPISSAAASPAQAEPLLDRIFAPERVRPAAAAATPDGAVVALAAPPPPAPASAAPAAAEAAPATKDESDAGLRVGTERAFYDEFTALGGKDASELRRKAEAVILGQSEDCMKVAMLRALWDTDPTQATPYFLRAITSVPDIPRVTGISVPAFAAQFLAQRASEPQVRTALERLVWSGSGTQPSAMQRQAAEALVATASEADLWRYSGNPILQEAVAAAARKE